MKYIFDFDDVLFNNTKQFKEHMFKSIALTGVPESEARKHYDKPEVHGKEFSLKKFITDLFSIYEVNYPEDALYGDIMRESRKFVNLELVEAMKKVGIENCYIVTNGDREFNTDKLVYSGMWDLLGGKRICIVPDTKRNAIEEICAKYPDEKIVFIDDKPKFLNDLKDIPRLKTILFDEHGLVKLRAEIDNNLSQELKRGGGKIK